MSGIHEEYGKEIRIFIFNGSHPSQDAILINGSFIIYEKGLLIKGPLSFNPVYTKWRDMSGVTLYEGETTKVAIDLKSEDGEIEAVSKDRPKDVEEFYELIEVQREKYRHYDELKELKVDLEDISIEMDTDRWENQVYLDTETGKIIHIPTELDEDSIYDEE
jgi:major membrane immunogen (membrane-anchored lipoprotein)